MSKQYDVVVLGAGPGGYVAAIRASQLGLKTAIVERKYWGGVCLNVGCIPSKALLRNAELVHIFKNEAKNFGIRVNGEVSFDYSEAFKRSRRVAEGRVRGVRFLMRKNKIDEYEGSGSFRDERSMDIRLNSGASETIEFRNCIIATGSTTRLLPGSKLSSSIVTYEEQILESKLPSSVIIAGAGAIGVEFAYLMSKYGVNVTLVEFLDRIVPLEDEEVSAELHKQFSRSGIKVHVKTRVEKIEDTGSHVQLTATGPDGQQSVFEAERVLQAIGFKPHVEGYGLEKSGVRLTGRGAIEINEKMQTSIPHIYAIGDVTGKLMLAHVAEAMGVVAAGNIAGVETVQLDYDMMPRATYCQPQVASFGYTEKQAAEKGLEVTVAKFPFIANGKAQGLGDPTGFVKLISNRKTGELLGGHMIGPDVTELLPELTLARMWELTAHEVARNVHSHPTLSEAIQEAVHGLAGHMINY